MFAFTILPQFLAVCQIHARFCGPPKPIWCLLILVLGCRVGEASNPGPTNSSTFTLGAFNPSGLCGKAPYVVSQLSDGDLWAISETHLTRKGFHDFQAGLRFAGSDFKYCVTGNHVPDPGSKTHHGQWKGVAMLSKFPTRALQMHGPPSVFESSRTLVSSTLVADPWVTGGVVYGEPDSHLYPQHMSHNEFLLQSVISQVCGLSVGPRFVEGDWNCLPDSIPSFQLLHNYGFRDLQDVAWSRWGILPKATCKHATRKDFCYISPELQSLLVDCNVADDVWPDHSVLIGTFQSLSTSIPRQIWVMPSPFPWPKAWNVDPLAWQTATGSPDEKYAAVWKQIEHSAAQALPFSPPKKSFGRAGTCETVPFLPGKTAPVKLGRHGDFAPQYLCASFRHAQWIRQVRRLQSFAHYASSRSHCVGDSHALALWGSIIRAKGFPPSFCNWWAQCNHRVHGAPTSFPLIPPSAAVATKLFESVALAVRAFESQLKKSSRAYARLRRENNPNLIFQDIKTHPEKGVSLLFQPAEAEISHVHAHDSSIELHTELPFHPETPIFCNGHKLDVIHAEGDCIWVEDTSKVHPGDKVTQISKIGVEEELFAAFRDAWTAKWGRHADVPLNRWDTIIAFARAHLRCQNMEWPGLSPKELFHTIKQKKTATSHGLDGVSLQDLRALPAAALSNFCDMFAHAETTGEWPAQVIAGRVTSLAKTEQPASPMDFRPITVFGILYRCWGSYHSKCILQHLEHVLPVGLYGSRPSCFAGQVWSHVLYTIENAQNHQVDLCGMMADLHKAFNMLPRLVVMEACAALGVPPPILVAWAGALTAMKRRFQIRNSMGPAILSTCGFPEGDAMSCVAMMGIDIIFHEWFRHFFPLAQPISYVDDWQLLLCDPSQMTSAAATLDKLVQELDLVLDKRKTHVWAVLPDGRKQLREQGFVLSKSCKNLGAHIQFTKLHTNGVQMERLQALSSLWPKLRLSSCGYVFKVRALKSAAWPKGLHAIAATTLSTSTFNALRAGAMKGLKEDHAGSNPMLHLGLVESPLADPHFWSIFQTFKFVKDCGRKEVVQETVAAMAAGQVPMHNSISASLLMRIHFLGWHVNHEGLLVDEFGTFSIFSVSCVELMLRLEWQWLKVVTSATAHRAIAEGLDRVWPQSTRRWLHMQESSDQALYRKLLNGTHITQDGKKHCQESLDEGCPFCMCSDSRYHRFWQCEHFDWTRRDLPRDILDLMPQLPEAVTCLGWDLMPTTMAEWWTYFTSLPAPTRPLKFQYEGPMFLFTDGSCLHQSDSHLRFAAWAVVLASPDQASAANSQIVESGVLPGLLQSAVRAEIFAIYRALEFAVAYGKNVTLWTDCNAVVWRLRRVLQGGLPKVGSTHADLWFRISQLINNFQGTIQVEKVAAHRELTTAKNVFEAWCFQHNNIADREAVAANLRRPGVFWKLLERHVNACEYTEKVNTVVRQVLLTISREVVRAQDRVETPIDVDFEPVVQAPLPAWVGLLPFSLPQGAIRWYGVDIVRIILSWFFDVVFTSKAPLKWVSHIQLYADFMGSTGNPGPINERGWKDGASVPHLALKGVFFSTANEVVYQGPETVPETPESTDFLCCRTSTLTYGEDAYGVSGCSVCPLH